MPRNPVTRAPNREVGIVNRRWLVDHPIQHESHLEKRFIDLVLTCPIVIDVIHQPIKVTFLYDEKARSYTPDFRVKLKDGSSIIIEVKPEKFAIDKQKRLSAAGRALEDRGEQFVTVTEKVIDREKLSARASRLLSFGRREPEPDKAQACLSHCQRAPDGYLTVQQLVGLGVPEYVVWSLVARRQLFIVAGIGMSLSEPVFFQPNVLDSHHVFFLKWLGIAQR